MRYKLMPELTAIVFFVIMGTQAINEQRSGEILSEDLHHLQTLEKLLPRYSNEVMRSNTISLLHYDFYAQLHQQIETTSSHLNHHLALYSDISQYLKLTGHYMQLVTMSNTSRKLISSSKLLNANVPGSQNVEFLSFVVRLVADPSEYYDSDIVSPFSNTTVRHEDVYDWPIVEQHINFLKETSTTISMLNRRIQNSTLLDTLAHSYHDKALELASSQQTFVLFNAGSLGSLLMLLIIILIRQKNQIELESNRYRKAADIKTTFLANMSHEIRTPMTGIIGLAELCLATKLTRSQKDYLDKLYFSANSLLTIINDILDFSKIESGKLNIEMVSFDHENLVENLDALVSQLARDKQLELIFDISPKLSQYLLGDPVRTSQILMNLLSNAVKFTEEGHVILSVSVEQHNDRSFVKYSVKDTGIGISSEQMDKLFNRFSQADESITRKFGGTGLGLSISKHLAEMMGGTISVTSTIGEGSEFTVVLPYAVDQSINSKQTCKVPISKNILFVEDNDITTTIVCRLLSEMNLSVTQASNIIEASLLLKTQTFDLALIDYKLEKTTCIPLLELIDNKKLIKNVIVFSAYDTVFLQQQLNTIAMPLQFLSKPLTRKRLQNAISQEELNANKKATKDNKMPPENSENHNEVTNGDKVTSIEGIEDLGVKKKILLVEDNRINQTIATNIVQNFGYDVEVAENGQIAIDKIKTTKFDVVLMDIQMPVLDGVQATKILREHFTKEELPIIALTANVTEDETALYSEIGMNDHLSKPYIQDQMKSVLSEALKSE